jgi:hypothetical protein
MRELVELNDAFELTMVDMGSYLSQKYCDKLLIHIETELMEMQSRFVEIGKLTLSEICHCWIYGTDISITLLSIRIL